MKIGNLVTAMIHDAATRYRAVVRLNQSHRSAAQAQQFHVAHMFLHNYFKYLRPRCCEGTTIAWSHLCDPSVQWVLIDHAKGAFLRTRHGEPARLKAHLRQWEEVPDEHASRHAMAKFLSQHSVSGMAAPGINGCGEPCWCGGHASRHLTGEACDLHGLDRLGLCIITAKPGKYHDPIEAVDSFLHEHQLYRPMAHLKGKRQELWHVEAIPTHLRHLDHHFRHLQHLTHGHHGGC